MSTWRLLLRSGLLVLLLVLLAGCFYSLDGSLVKAHDGSVDVVDLDLPPDTNVPPADSALGPDGGLPDLGPLDLGGGDSGG